MIVRRVAPDEAEALWTLRLRALREHPRAFASSEVEDEPRPLAEVRERLASAPVIGAFDDAGAIVGMAGLYLDRNLKQRHRAHVWGVYVAPEARGTGTARRMLEAVIAAARELSGVELLHLTVAADAGPARALYEKLGFRTYGTDTRALKVDGAYVDELLMVLAL